MTWHAKPVATAVAARVLGVWGEMEAPVASASHAHGREAEGEASHAAPSVGHAPPPAPVAAAGPPVALLAAGGAAVVGLLLLVVTRKSGGAKDPPAPAAKEAQVRAPVAPPAAGAPPLVARARSCRLLRAVLHAVARPAGLAAAPARAAGGAAR